MLLLLQARLVGLRRAGGRWRALQVLEQLQKGQALLQCCWCSTATSSHQQRLEDGAALQAGRVADLSGRLWMREVGPVVG